MAQTRKQTTGPSDAEDTIDTAMMVIDDVVDRAMALLKNKKDRKKLLITIEEYCVNHSDAR